MRTLFDGRDPKAVLFDLDGTLVDSVPDLAQAVDRMLVELGRAEAGEARVRQWVGNGAQLLVKRALCGQLSLDGVAEDAQFDRAYRLFLQFYGEHTSGFSTLYPGVLDCLDGLRQRGIALAVVTNKPMRFTEPMLAGFGLSDYFQCVLGGDSLSVKKPDPAPLLQAMRQLGSGPADTLMVGDSVNDLRAARAAGCPVACVPYGYNHGEPIAVSKPDLLVERLDQLL
ncbi:phosphoglycolate phosphatase [Marinobacterium arenosum]|uniref:phosphoglycolate phosphatase n=1 Tax=Marinobacterium arenosum TaxID=2862496 RepID=UPI001C989034|nr:phosphoglycolate phosphatase [Marinobacterium arenosum]MBY4676084.1 phosphoglycolate phosphatase [Marinobacterium arenosum]